LQTFLYIPIAVCTSVKFLIGITPSGEISFLSKAFGGRATDSEITNQSGLLEYLEPGDQVLSDKGFPGISEQVGNAGAFLVMPPFSQSGRQFSAQENKSGYECASVRIHVERAIARMKRFEFLHFVHSCHLKNIDKVLIVIAAISNCEPDLIKQ